MLKEILLAGKTARKKSVRIFTVTLSAKHGWIIDVKAIVLRINSGGGSALVSENLWRELTLAKADKPVVVSFGDVSASGGYYLSCNADSIFADPMTITGSIGVFSMFFNTQDFFKNKLGITFDGVHTARQPDAITHVSAADGSAEKIYAK